MSQQRGGYAGRPETVPDMLSCSICMESYDDDLHQSKLLPCHHSFCKMCLVYLAGNHSYIDCPNCRKRTILGNLAPEGVILLQTNFYVNQMRDLVTGDPKVNKHKACKKHSKPFSHFCKTCEIEVCSECCNGDHREAVGHLTQDLARARQEQRHLLEVQVAEAQETLLAARPKIKTLEAEKGCLFAAKNEAETCIDQSFDIYFEMLRNRKEKLKQDLKQIYKQRRKKLDEEVDGYNRQINSLEGIIEHCQEAVSGGNIADVIGHKTKLQAKNQEFRSSVDQNSRSGNNYIRFEVDESEGHLRSVIQDLGAIILHGCLPVGVKAFEQPVIAGLYSNISIEIKNDTGELLPSYPITVKILDAFDDEIHCNTKPRNCGRYECILKPKISGLHRVKILFLDHVIQGGEFNLNVISNNPVACIGNQGSENELEYPRAVATTSDGSVYTVDTGNNRIQVFSKTGDFLFNFQISNELENFSSCGIAINREQNTILCPEVEMNEAEMVRATNILVYSMEGRLLHRLNFQDALNKALSVAVNSFGHLIVADYELNSVFIFDKQGRRLLRKFGEKGSKHGQFDHPTFVCVGEEDSIIVSDGDNHRIQVFDKMGKFLYSFGKRGNGKGEFNMPFGVTADVHGNILVVDGGNKRVQIFKKGGEFQCCIESLGDRLSAPRGISVTSDGYVLVADRDNHCIKKYKYMHSTLL